MLFVTSTITFMNLGFMEEFSKLPISGNCCFVFVFAKGTVGKEGLERKLISYKSYGF